jgi:3-hydroxyisobutyrate dehydrogenase-like beta-hydroxyacid dehydrogenase
LYSSHAVQREAIVFAKPPASGKIAVHARETQGMDIGFIGLGKMGFPMARRLVEAGHAVTVYDTRREAVDGLVALGAQGAGSVREVADRVETVMASLPTPDVVHAVAVGKGGLIEGNRVRRFVDLSTTGAAMAKRIFETLQEREITQIDSPVSGGVTGAEKGTLAVMVSGPCEQAMALQPVLSIIGKFFFIGEQPGAGQTMKLCNNVLSATAMAATSEAIVTGVKAGLDPRVMLDVINAGSGRNTATESKFPKNIVPRTFDLGFTNGLMMKDVRLFLSEAEALGVPLDVAQAVARLLQLACTEIGVDADLTTIVQPIERRAGAEVKAPE